MSYHSIIISETFYLNYGFNHLNFTYFKNMFNIFGFHMPVLFNSASIPSDLSKPSAKIAIYPSIGAFYSDYKFDLDLTSKMMESITEIGNASLSNLRYAVKISLNSEVNYEKLSGFLKSYRKNNTYTMNATMRIADELYYTTTTVTVKPIFTSITELENVTFDLVNDVDDDLILNLFSGGYDLNSCITNCSDYGMCTYTDSLFTCVCDSIYYGGPNCNVDQRHCFNNTCMHNGTCNEFYSAGFECKCPSLYYGTNCENKVDLCANVTCSYHGNCMVDNTNNSVWCDCYSLYSGDACEAKSPELETIETAATISTSLAIVSLVSLFVCAIASDIADRYMKLRRNKIKNSIGNKSIMSTNVKKKCNKRSTKKEKKKKRTTLIHVQPQ